MRNDILYGTGRRPNTETIAAIEELEAMKRGEMPERTMSIEEVFGKRGQ